MSELEHVLAAQARLGEGPLWCADEGALYFVDIEGPAIHRYDPASGHHDVFPVDLPVTALGRRAAGGFVAATRDGFAFWDTTSQRLAFIADPESNRPHARFNDGAVDPTGRFWAGTMSDAADNALYRLDPDLAVHRMETGITVSNGLGWSPDRRRMVFTDSRRHIIYVYDYDAATGAIANRRPFVYTPGEAGVPDGLAIDAEGCVWSARWGGWKVTRYDPEGRVLREIPMPVEFPTSCAFGGPNLDELYITSAWTRVPTARRGEQPLAGDVFRVRAGVAGLLSRAFKG